MSPRIEFLGEQWLFHAGTTHSDTCREAEPAPSLEAGGRVEGPGVSASTDLQEEEGYGHSFTQYHSFLISEEGSEEGIHQFCSEVVSYL